MPGYWGLPEETADVPSPTAGSAPGDVGRVDEDGYVSIVDRIKDMIISGGENIYPAEVEDVLTEHPDIVECAVIGVPDEKWGEVGRAVVVPREGAGARRRPAPGLARGRLAKYKIPKSVVFARRAAPHRLREAPQARVREQARRRHPPHRTTVWTENT